MDSEHQVNNDALRTGTAEEFFTIQFAAEMLARQGESSLIDYS